MASYTTTQPREFALVARFASLTGSATERYKKYRLYRETYVALNAMSDRELDDIGVAPGTIREIASRVAYGK